MVHTRGRGARPEGFSQYEPPKLPTSAKRQREVEDNPEDSASKRRRATPPEQSKFLFSKTRNRSLLTSAPAKLSSRRESPYYRNIVEPASPESASHATQSGPGSAERNRPRTQRPQPAPETPTRHALQPQGGLFGSVKRIFGYFRGGPNQGVAVNGEQVQQGDVAEQHNEASPAREEEYEEVVEEDEGSPTPIPRRITYERDSPEIPESEVVDSRIFTKEHFKRRRGANTIAGREQLAAMNDANFNPTSTAGTGKRKLASENGFIPGPKQGGFGIDDSYLDMDNEVEGIGESQLEDSPTTPVNKRPTLTPLRSALRQNMASPGTNGRSAKSVRINSVPTSAKAVYGQYGPAGDYRGSTFADLSPRSNDSNLSDTPSSLAWDVRNIHSPNTLRNTYQNTPHGGQTKITPTITDPNDPTWRPTPANPRPGQFILPDFDDDDEDEESTVTLDQVQGEVPTQPPSTPKMSHAELPQSTTSEQSGFTGHTDSVLSNDTQESKLEKARLEAQKYKPAKSSRLSLTEQARSRSSSPPGLEDDSTWCESQLEMGTPDALRPRGYVPHTPDDTTMMSKSSFYPVSREDLDNTVVGEDGMTEYGREHQYDQWAKDLFDKVPDQTYVEAGIASQYVDNLVRKNWTARDTRESVEFWDREFDEGIKAERKAREQGRELIWVTDPDEIIELEQKGY